MGLRQELIARVTQPLYRVEKSQTYIYRNAIGTDFFPRKRVIPRIHINVLRAVLRAHQSVIRRRLIVLPDH